ncbi:MAG TPA: hypothetical protein VHF47_09045 [Acidimicrobiales bacterium]|nr:hypothetical protein [Acidimicrobiales bacterium]
MARVRLPISGAIVEVRPPAGEEDALLAETEVADLGLRLGVTLVERLASAVEPATLDWAALTRHDLDVALLAARATVAGDGIVTHLLCDGPACGAPITVRFSVKEYVDHHRPRQPRTVEADGTGRWRLRDGSASFRLPTVGDLLAVASLSDAERELARRCTDPPAPTGAVRRRVDAALAALAPSLSDRLGVSCPACSSSVDVWFDPLAYTLEELRSHARWVFADVHLLARSYHWTEERILALPRPRRLFYVDQAMSERAAG